MQIILLVFLIPICLALLVVILLQQGKDAGFSGAFGAGGGSQTILGSRRGDFLSKATWILSAVFVVLALLLSYYSPGRRQELAPPSMVPESIPADEPAAASTVPAPPALDTAPSPAGDAAPAA